MTKDVQIYRFISKLIMYKQQSIPNETGSLRCPWSPVQPLLVVSRRESSSARPPAVSLATLVADLGSVAVLVGHVLHGLSAAIRKQHIVLPLRHLPVSELLVSKLQPRLLVRHVILELVV